MEQARLRTGGLPLMDPEVEWPSCPHCQGPMLFRAQLPLHVTCLVPWDDTRLVLVFECHDVQAGTGCDEGRVVVTSGSGLPRAPPATFSLGGQPPHLVLQARGGMLVPLEDGCEGPAATSPELDVTGEEPSDRPVRGVLEPPPAGRIDCGCVRPRATTIQLFPHTDGISLGWTTVRLCLRCHGSQLQRRRGSCPSP
jgi:hypothetical protein